MVVIAEINAVSFIIVLSHLLRSLVREKRCLLAVKCVFKSQRWSFNDAAALVGVLLWSILFLRHSMFQCRQCSKWRVTDKKEVDTVRYICKDKPNEVF